MNSMTEGMDGRARECVARNASHGVSSLCQPATRGAVLNSQGQRMKKNKGVR